MALLPLERVGSEHGGGEQERLALRLFATHHPLQHSLSLLSVAKILAALLSVLLVRYQQKKQ